MGTSHLYKAERQIANSDEEYFFLDKAHPRSVYNLVPPYVREAIDAIPTSYMMLSERQLRREVNPCFQTSQLRTAFWSEYRRAQLAGSKMNISTICEEIVPQQSFAQNIIRDPERFSWIMRPPAAWVSGMNAILNDGLNIMYDAVNAPNVFDEKGNVNPKVLNSIMSVIKQAIIVVHGLPTLRTESKSVNINVNQSTPAQVADDVDLDEKRRIRDQLLRERDAKEKTIDVTPHLPEGGKDAVESRKDETRAEGDSDSGDEQS